jgi:GTP-binding protein
LGLSQIESEEWVCGDIITIAGIPDIFVWETIGIGEFDALPTISIDEPTMTMEFLVNDSPFAGKEGKYMTTRNLKERLDRELQTNVWLRLDEDGGKFVVSGKWELHLGVLIESIRREWREMQAGAPEVIFKMIDGKKHEPIESIIINVKENLAGAIIEAISNRKGTMMSMNNENGMTTLEFDIPTRWLLGFRAEFILLTKWDGIIYGSFSHYAPHLWIINKRQVGSMISGNLGKAMKYGIFKLQDRGPIFVDPAQEIYEGMIVGEHLKGGDLIINLTTNKQMTNVRNAGNDEAMKLDPIIHMTLEDALWYISTDELVEVTPKNIRIRKKYLTDNARAIAKKNWQL